MTMIDEGVQMAKSLRADDQEAEQHDVWGLFAGASLRDVSGVLVLCTYVISQTLTSP